MANKKRVVALTALAASAAMLLASCSSRDESPSASATGAAPVVLTWWHNNIAADNGENPGGDYWQKVADDYTALHPNVTFKIEQIETNDLQRTRVPAALQSGDAPDIFQAWGGGEMVQQVAAGYLLNLSDLIPDTIAEMGGGVAPWTVDGVAYGVPYTFGVEGIWYRKSLFEQAGITSEPKTFDELSADVQKLKDAGIVPIAVGAGDKWPAAHWWYNFALRSCAEGVIPASAKSFDFSDPCFVQAGTDLKAFIDTAPFQDQFTATQAQQIPTSSAGLVATGKAAMELMGHWNLGVYRGFGADDAGKQAIEDDLGWFPVPATSSGKGDPSAALGGGDGFACYKDAPVECADFLAYLVSTDVQKGYAAIQGSPLPANPNAASAVASPVMQEIAAVAGTAAYTQLWLDTTYGTNVGGAMNDAIVAIFAGTGSAQNVVDLMTAAAATQ
jgi:ABC-type glycerol-3-phosphate transport system substrate-binding protein